MAKSQLLSVEYLDEGNYALTWSYLPRGIIEPTFIRSLSLHSGRPRDQSILEYAICLDVTRAERSYAVSYAHFGLRLLRPRLHDTSSNCTYSALAYASYISEPWRPERQPKMNVESGPPARTETSQPDLQLPWHL